MRTIKEIDRYIHRCFFDYGLVYSGFLGVYDDENKEMAEVPISLNGTLNMALIKRAAVVLGLSVEEILNTDADAAGRWSRKYAYFQYLSLYETARTSSFQGESAEAQVLRAVFDVSTRYNFPAVKDRMVNVLRKSDEYRSGMYHENAEITHFCAETDNFFHFDAIGDMVQSYLDMYDRADCLFSKALCCDLSEDEIREYNFLVSALGLRDRYYSSDWLLYYEMLRKFKAIYKEERVARLEDVAIILSKDRFTPWKCAEMVNHADLLQRLVNIYVKCSYSENGDWVKKDIRKFAMSVSKYYCSFIWSDAEKLHDEDGLPDEYFAAEWEAETGEVLTDENWPRERTYIYVDKTDEEMRDDAEYAAKLLKLAGTSKKGGISVPCMSKCVSDADRTAHIVARVDAKLPKWEDTLHE